MQQYINAQNVTIKIKKSADNYLDSDYSNEVELYFLKKVGSINVITNLDG